MSDVRQRRRLDLDPGDDDDDDLVENPRDDSEDLVMSFLPIAFVIIAIIGLISMYYISTHDDMKSYFYTIHHGPPVHHRGKHYEKRLTKDQLAAYNGITNPAIYLAILGQVFDVTKGKRHYGPNGPYNYFAGIDRSRAFSSGLKDDGEDISTLKNKQLLSVSKWLSFFANHKEYARIGTVEGVYYDRIGHARPIIQTIRERIREAQAQIDNEATIDRCNMEWTAEAGATTIWCQDDTKYPRKHGAEGHCGCFTPAEFATDTSLELYKGCNEKRCAIPT